MSYHLLGRLGHLGTRTAVHATASASAHAAPDVLRASAWCLAHDRQEAQVLIGALPPAALSHVIAANADLAPFQRLAVAELGRRAQRGAFDPHSYARWSLDRQRRIRAELYRLNEYERWVCTLWLEATAFEMMDYAQACIRRSWDTTGGLRRLLLPENGD